MFKHACIIRGFMAVDSSFDLCPRRNHIFLCQSPEKSQRLVFVKGSYGDEELLDNVFKKYKISSVMHFGGFKAVGESKKLPMMYYSNNLGGIITYRDLCHLAACT